MTSTHVLSSNIPLTLQEWLRNGQVLPFVGAGVSMAVKHRLTGNPLFPSWKNLLLAAADQLEGETKRHDANIVRGFLEKERPDYLEAAKYAREGFGSVWFDFLQQQIDPLRSDVEESSLSLAKAIWQLSSQLIVTTNYDRVLRWASQHADDLQDWDIEAAAEQAQFLRNKLSRPTVWHLHGQIENKAGLILTPDGYQRLYPDQDGYEVKFQAALETLRSCLASYSFLFIGFSVDDEHFGTQLKAVSRIYEGANGPHYALVKEAHRSVFKQNNPSIEVLPFSDFGDPLVKLVIELGEIARGSNGESEKSVETPPIEVSSPAPVLTPNTNYSLDNSVFFVPFSQKGDQVIGREDALQQVRRQLTAGKRTAIGQAASFRGLGGLGKTQLAVEYAYRFRADYPKGIIWINADQDIDGQLSRLCDAAGWLAPQSEPQQKLEVTRHRLRSYSDCLLIFDNLEKLEDIKEYLPGAGVTPHLLVTTRKDVGGFPPIPLDPLNPDQSLQLLVQEAEREPNGQEEQEAASRIAESLGGLPLALELAGAYLRYRETISWLQYDEFLRQNPREALQGKHMISFTDHERDLYRTLKISDEVLDEDPRLRQIIDLLTWSDSAPMGVALLCAILGVQKPVALTDALSLGVALRLLQKKPQTESYTLHRLVSQVRREELPLESRANWVNDVCQRMGDWFQEIREDFTRLAEYEAEADHLRAWQKYAEQYTPQHSPRLLWLQAYPPFHRGRYQEIKVLVERAYEQFLSCGYSDTALKAHILNDIGFAYHGLGDYRRCLELQEKALAIRHRLYGDEQPDTAMSYGNIGSTYHNLGDYRSALELKEKALAIYKKLHGEEHPNVARSYDYVGITYDKLGDHRRALELKEKALVMTQKLQGEQHPNTATTYDSVGSTYGKLGDHQHALELKAKALAIRQKLHGEEHPGTARSYNNVGMAEGNLGNHRRALEYVERALKLIINILGLEQPDTLQTVLNKAVVLSNLNRNFEAKQLLNNWLRKLPRENSKYAEIQQQRDQYAQSLPGAHKSKKPHKKKRR